MKAFTLLFFIFLFNIQVGYCQQINNNLIKVECEFTGIGPKKMSEIISDIKYIPLETNPDCLLSYVNVPVFGQNIIVRSSADGGIYRFSEYGKFLNRIGNIGRGPNEYVDACDVVLIGDTVYVVSNFTNSILCYSLDGQILKRYHLNLNGNPSSIVKLQDNSYMVSLSSTSKSGRLIRTDNSFKAISGFFKDSPVKYTAYPLPFPATKNRILYFYSFTDTIYEVTKGIPNPSILIDHGRYNKPGGFVSEPGKSEDDYKYPIITSLGLSDDYLILLLFYMPKKITGNVLYRFQDEKTIQFTELLNDFDYGNKVERIIHSTTTNQLIFTLQAKTILDRFSSMTDVEKSDPKSTRFIEMASKLKPESNPVLMICKLK